MISETSEAVPAEGGLDISALLDGASLVVAIVVGIGSALVTGWIQVVRDKRQRRMDAVAHLIAYERALGDAVGNLEAQECHLDGPAFPDNLNELRIAAYPHFRFLKTGTEEDQAAYWHLYNPGATESKFIGHAVDAYAESHAAASATVERVAAPRVRRRFADVLRTARPSNAV